MNDVAIELEDKDLNDRQNQDSQASAESEDLTGIIYAMQLKLKGCLKPKKNSKKDQW